MTISKQQQTDNIDDTLRVILNIVGENHLDGAMFDLSDPRFGNAIETTWERLGTLGCVQQIGMWHRLTPHGLIEALKAADKLCDVKMKEDLGRLCAPLKRRCEEGSGRHRTHVTIHELAEETGFSEGWICNIIDSHLIRVCLKQRMSLPQLKVGAAG